MSALRRPKEHRIGHLDTDREELALEMLAPERSQGDN